MREVIKSVGAVIMVIVVALMLFRPKIQQSGQDKETIKETNKIENITATPSTNHEEVTREPVEDTNTVETEHNTVAEDTEVILPAETITEEQARLNYLKKYKLDNFGEIIVLVPGNTVEKYFFAEADYSEPFTDEYLTYSSYVADKLNAALAISVMMNVPSGEQYRKAYEACVSAGEKIDIVQASPKDMAYFISAGTVVNLSQYNDIFNGFNDYWWDSDLISELRYGSSVFALGGAISPLSMHNMQGVFVNTSLLSRARISVNDLYNAVRQGAWDLTYFYTICQTASANIGTSYNVLSVTNEGLHNFRIGADLAPYVADNDGVFSFNFSRGTQNMERLNNFVDAFYSFAKQNKVVIETESEPGKTFTSNRAIFHVGNVRLASDISAKGISYGILPMPKLDASQREYITPTEGLLYAVSTCSNIPETAAAYLEMLCIEMTNRGSWDAVNQTYLLKYATTADDEEMLNLMMASMTYDVHSYVIPTINSSDGVADVITQYMIRNDGTIKSWMTQYENSIKSNLVRLNKIWAN